MRIISGVGLVLIGIVALGVEFSPKGLLIPIENPLFILFGFTVSVTIGFGGLLFSGYPLKMFFKPLLIITLWTFVVFLPIFSSPIPQDAKNLIPPLSLLIIAVLYGKYEKSKEKENVEKKGE
jgi:hypothetical protein